MASRVSFENSTEVGVFAKLTNKYCLVASGGSENFYSVFEEELGPHMPVVHMSVGLTKLVGRMIVGNSNGVLLPAEATDMELQVLRNSLPDTIKIQRVEDKLNALGNVIACNDYVALLHPEVEKVTEEIVQDVLGVETYKTTIAGQPLVGSYCCLTNKGGLVHPMCSVAELDALSSLVQIPLCAGTVNRGRDVIGTGIVANDWTAFCGTETTAMELNVVDAIFKLSDKQDVFAAENKGAMVDQLI